MQLLVDYQLQIPLIRRGIYVAINSAGTVYVITTKNVYFNMFCVNNFVSKCDMQ